MDGQRRFAVIGTDPRLAAAGRALARAGFAVGGPEQTALADYILLPLPLDESRTPLAGFKYFALGDASRLTLRLRASAPGSMAIYLDEACTRKAAEVTFPASTDWQEVQGSFSAPAGTFPLFFRLNCTGRVDWESFILT